MERKSKGRREEEEIKKGEEAETKPKEIKKKEERKRKERGKKEERGISNTRKGSICGLRQLFEQMGLLRYR